jgi:ribonuclease VapC
MTLDSSALIAILFAEPGYLRLVDRILEADHVRLGAPTLAETSVVFVGRKGARSAESVDGLIQELAVTIVPFGVAEWRVAADAFRRFGRGRHAAPVAHPRTVGQEPCVVSLHRVMRAKVVDVRCIPAMQGVTRDITSSAGERFRNHIELIATDERIRGRWGRRRRRGQKHSIQSERQRPGRWRR